MRSIKTNYDLFDRPKAWPADHYDWPYQKPLKNQSARCNWKSTTFLYANMVEKIKLAGRARLIHLEAMPNRREYVVRILVVVDDVAHNWCMYYVCIWVIRVWWWGSIMENFRLVGKQPLIMGRLISLESTSGRFGPLHFKAIERMAPGPIERKRAFQLIEVWIHLLTKHWDGGKRGAKSISKVSFEIIRVSNHWRGEMIIKCQSSWLLIFDWKT